MIDYEKFREKYRTELILNQFRRKFKTELLEDYGNYLQEMLESDLTCVEDWHTWSEEEFDDKDKWSVYKIVEEN